MPKVLDKPFMFIQLGIRWQQKFGHMPDFAVLQRLKL